MGKLVHSKITVSWAFLEEIGLFVSPQVVNHFVSLLRYNSDGHCINRWLYWIYLLSLRRSTKVLLNYEWGSSITVMLISSLPPTPLITVTHWISRELAEAACASSKRLTENSIHTIQSWESCPVGGGGGAGEGQETSFTRRLGDSFYCLLNV